MYCTVCRHLYQLCFCTHLFSIRQQSAWFPPVFKKLIILEEMKLLSKFNLVTWVKILKYQEETAISFFDILLCTNRSSCNLMRELREHTVPDTFIESWLWTVINTTQETLDYLLSVTTGETGFFQEQMCSFNYKAEETGKIISRTIWNKHFIYVFLFN